MYECDSAWAVGCGSKEHCGYVLRCASLIQLDDFESVGRNVAEWTVYSHLEIEQILKKRIRLNVPFYDIRVGCSQRSRSRISFDI